jgi:ankyrin repeat protein
MLLTRTFCLSILTATLLYGDVSFDLLRYSYIGDTAKITESLMAKALIEARDEDEMTPLLLAAYENRMDALKLLIDKGADVNATSFSGRNALNYAIQNANPEMVKLLLSKGAALILDGTERDILYSGVVGKNLEVLRIILPYEKNLNRTYLKNSDQKEARNLLKTTLLIQAVESGSLENVKLLMQMGADINQPNDRGETPILTALREGEFEIAAYLSDHGAKLDARDAMGNTVLSYALNHRRSALALRALEVSDLSVWFSRDCVRAKDWAWRDEEDIREDKNDPLEWNTLHIAALNNDAEVIKVLLSKGMKIDEPNRGEIEKLPALAWAIKRGHYEAFKTLLDAGADPYELYRGPGQGDTGLMYVAGGGSFYTPLSYAMSGDSQNPKIIDTLLNLPHFKRYAHSETHAFYKFMLILATDEGGERQNYAQAIVERFKKEGFRPNSSDIELEEEMKKATKQEKASPARVQSPPEEPVNPVAKKREITLSSLYTAGSLKDFKTTLKDSIAQNELNALCRESNLTGIAIDSIESRRTPQAITLHLFDVAYRLGLPIDYKKVLEKAQKANAKEIVKAAHYYGGFEPAPQNVEERYTKYVDAGMIDKALEYYLSRTKELNAVQGMHNWSKAPLTIAIDHRKKGYYERLVKAGAHIDDANHENIDRLISQNDLESIKLFVKLGMNPNHIGRYENSYFFRCIHHAHKNAALAKEFLKLGYNPMNPNLPTKRNIEDLSLAYKVAVEKGDTELSTFARRVLAQYNGAIDADASEILMKEGKAYLKGSDTPLTGTLKSGYGEYEKKTQYANGLKEGRLHVIKPNGDPFAIAEYKHGIMIYGVIVHDADKGEATVCSFDSYGILKGCSEHSSDKKPFTPKLSRERVREILGEL